jgi:two-component system sensor histidine kinase QseC
VKLFTKYNRVNIAASIIVFLVGCVAFYLVLHYILLKQLDVSLRSERNEIRQYVKEHDQLPEIENTREQQIAYAEVQEPFTTVTYESKQVEKGNDDDWVRQLSFGIAAGNKNFKITVSKSEVETEDLLKLILMIAAGMIALILLAGYIINRLIIQSIWKPFYSTINTVTQYKLSGQESLQLPAVQVSEFSLLNESLNNMTDRVQKDYQVLKEFTSNAAHEMQTPLAVIRNHTEALMQDEKLIQQHNRSITTIEQSVQRLTRLNQALLLLTKIENRQFILNEEVRFDKLVSQKIAELSELISAEKLRSTIELGPVTIHFHQYLAEVVIGNLLNNAIRYNKENGSIDIQLDNRSFTISNSSDLPRLDIEKLYKRFYRHPETKADGNGLGLSIVKQICELAGYRLEYQYMDKSHVFSIKF